MTGGEASDRWGSASDSTEQQEVAESRTAGLTDHDVERHKLSEHVVPRPCRRGRDIKRNGGQRRMGEQVEQGGGQGRRRDRGRVRLVELLQRRGEEGRRGQDRRICPVEEVVVREVQEVLHQIREERRGVGGLNRGTRRGEGGKGKAESKGLASAQRERDQGSCLVTNVSRKGGGRADGSQHGARPWSAGTWTLQARTCNSTLR